MACSTCGVIEIPDATLAALCVTNWGDKPLSEQATAFAVAIAESCGGGSYAHADAWNQCCGQYCEDSRGPWQINVASNANPSLGSWDLFDPAINAQAARIVYNGSYGFSPWTTYTQGYYLAHMSRAYAAIAALVGPPQPPPPQPGSPDVGLIAVLSCTDAQWEVNYGWYINDGQPTWLLVSTHPDFATHDFFLGPYTQGGSVLVPVSAAGMWYAQLNRYALIGNYVAINVPSLSCGSLPPGQCPSGYHFYSGACVPDVVPPLSLPGGAPLLLAGIVGVLGYYVWRWEGMTMKR